MTVSNVNVSAASLNNYVYIASGGETSKSGADSNNAVLSYIPGKEQVFLNGVLLVRGSDYTAADGSSITNLTALVASDVLEVVAFSPFTVATAVPLTTVTAKGDLIAATASGAVTNVAVGSNNTLLVANSSATAGVNWTSTIAGAALSYPFENWYINASAFAGYTAYLQTNNAVHYLTSSATSNGTLNITYASGTTLNSVMSVGQAITFSLLITNGSTAYYPNAFQVDGSSVTPKWSGGSAPSAGNASNTDVYSFTILKTASATFTVLAAGPIKYA